MCQQTGTNHTDVIRFNAIEGMHLMHNERRPLLDSVVADGAKFKSIRILGYFKYLAWVGFCSETGTFRHPYVQTRRVSVSASALISVRSRILSDCVLSACHGIGGGDDHALRRSLSM